MLTNPLPFLKMIELYDTSVKAGFTWAKAASKGHPLDGVWEKPLINCTYHLLMGFIKGWSDNVSV